jgi:predicted Zn-dependent protease
MKFTPKQPPTNVNVSKTHPLKEFLILACGLLLIIVGIYVLLGLAVDLVAPRISPETEEKMARMFMGSRRWAGEGTDREKAVQAIVGKIQADCARLPYHFTIHVVHSPMINALALPGGHIIVFTGLLEKVDSENELAFILAHEMGHYAHRDHLRAFGRGMIFTAISATLFGADSPLATMIGQALNLTELSFSRSQETWADEFGLQVLNCAYGHAGGATDFFEKIPKEQDPGRFGHYFASHPANLERIRHIRSFAGELGYRFNKTREMPDRIRPAG